MSNKSDLARTSEGKNLYTYDEASKILGVNPVTLRRWVMEGFLAHYKIGRCVRFDYSQIVEAFKVPVRGSR